MAELGQRQLDMWAIRRLRAGWRVAAVAHACGVSIRTVYRWRVALRQAETVTVGGWSAQFTVPDGEPPRRITPWEPNR